jgi:hypothetical protein
MAKKQATETTEGTDEQAAPAPEPSDGDVPKLADKQAKAIEDAEAAAKNPPDLPVPGTTPDLDVISTDEATSLNPNIVVSGTKPDGSGGQELLDVVNPAVANAGILPPRVGQKPQSPSVAPEDTTQRPGPGEVLFECTADNRPFFTGGPMDQGSRYVLSKEEADLLTQTRAGHVVSSGAPASDENARQEGEDV